MGVIAQHQLSTFASPVAGATPIDANTVRGNDNTVKTAYNAHDADTTIHLQNGLVGSRPAASIAGQMWLATDTGAVYAYLDNGSAWVEVNYMRNTGGTITGNVVITGTLGVTGVATFTAQPILSSLTASQAVFSDGSKGLVSNAITGTGNVVMSASPTLTGTVALAAFAASGNGTVGGTLGVTGLSTLTGGALLPNAVSLNAVDTGAITRALVQLNASNQIVLCPNNDVNIKWGRALVECTSGASVPTFGKLGSGPGSTAQACWLRVILSDGTTGFIPAWS